MNRYPSYDAMAEGSLRDQKAAHMEAHADDVLDQKRDDAHDFAPPRTRADRLPFKLKVLAPCLTDEDVTIFEEGMRVDAPYRKPSRDMLDERARGEGSLTICPSARGHALQALSAWLEGDEEAAGWDVELATHRMKAEAPRG